MKNLLVLLLSIGCFHTLSGQRLTSEREETEEQLRASTKQINQFFRRFNGEEDENGKRYYPSDKNYRSASLRRKYVPVLFDTQTSQIKSNEANTFLKHVTNKKSPVFLDFHAGDWLAEVNTTFKMSGKLISGTLYMRLQQQGQGYEWIIEDVFFQEFKQWFDKDTSINKKFLHPMSHELGFMTLKKALRNNDHAEQFTHKKYEPDYLTLFLYELNRGNLKFESVKKVNFHFFDIDGYYFLLSNFNRPGMNSGWLISDLVPLADSDQKQQMVDYIYGRE